jgi:YegS/Rv2252/BmrU family lipid kinase
MQTEWTEKTSIAGTPGVLAAIIANPTSGSYAHHAAHLQETVAFLQEHGWDVALRLTEAPGDARRLAREAVNQQAEVVVAAGGDGTINEVIQELAGTETALGVLPIGTVNDWAREIGIPLDVRGARDILVHGRTKHIDLGHVNEHYFLLMAGIGLDGTITQKVEQHPLKHLGVVGYLLASVWYGLRYRSFVTSVVSDERVEQIPALQIVVGNTQLYGGAIKFTWQAKADDGLLDVVIVRRRGVLGRLLVAMELFLPRKKRMDHLHKK